MPSSTLRNGFAMLAAGVAGGVAWRLGLQWIFGVAQPALTNPAHQSAKMLAAFAPGHDAPRMYANPLILWYGLIALGCVHALVYAVVFAGRPGHWLRRGAAFGIAAAALMVPWFEFYLPWNVLGEPALLVALEVACWLGVQLIVGVTIASGYELLRARPGTMQTRSS
jgi:hypothetical protein